MVDDVVGRAKGGVARAVKLQPAERSAIAQRAAQARWGSDSAKAEYTGELKIGELSIPCAVLPDGTRVLSQRGVGSALGRSYGGQNWKEKAPEGGGGGLPFYIGLAALKPFISNELMALISEPRLYRHGKGGGVAQGLVAAALPQVCNVWLSAREAHYRKELRLTEAALAVAQRAEILMRGLAEVGIVALVDEATGYQDVRDREALQELLNAYLRKELAAWAKRFPDEFYSQIFRLRRWTKKAGRESSRPQIVAYYTKDIVYSRLAPGILEELEKRNPSENGRRKQRHHQWLTDDVGHPALAQHLHAVITLMRVPPEGGWDEFMRMLDIAHPRRTDTMLLPLLQEQRPNISSSEPLPLFAQLSDAQQK